MTMYCDSLWDIDVFRLKLIIAICHINRTEDKKYDHRKRFRKGIQQNSTPFHDVNRTLTNEDSRHVPQHNKRKIRPKGNSYSMAES